MYNPYRKKRSPILQGNVVECLLQNFIKQCTFEDIMTKVDTQSIFAVKTYLFILINHDLISYHGKKRLFVIELEGYNLLKYIYLENARSKIHSNEIKIIIE